MAELSRRPGTLLRLLPPTAALVIGALLAACATVPRQPAAPSGARAVPRGFPPTVRFLANDEAAVAARRHAVLRGLAAAARGRPVRILALSGGGAGGAFAAGALVGLSRAGDRREFEAVTGVSAGALLAPLAFLGPGWNAAVERIFASGRIQRVMRRPFLGVLFRPSIYSGKPLRELVDEIVTDPLVAAVAAEAAKGRLLYVATTNLDDQELVIWDLGAIASHGGEAARRLFREVLLASASLPGVFPPVRLAVEEHGKTYDELHVDGGASLPFFIPPELSAGPTPGSAEPTSGGELAVIVNAQLIAAPSTTRDRLRPVLLRSLSAQLMHASRRSLELAAASAQRLGIKLEFAYIPEGYPFAGPLDFERNVVKDLFDFGARCAAAGRLWVTGTRELAARSSAPGAVANPASDCPRPVAAYSP